MVSQNQFVSKGDRVRVLSVSASRIVVEGAANDEDDAESGAAEAPPTSDEA